MVALATAFVELRGDDSKLGSDVAASAGSAGTSAGRTFTSRFGAALKIGAVLAGAFVARGGIEFMRESVREASNLNESLNAVNVTFGKNAGGIKALGRDAASAVGLSSNEFNSLAVQFSSFAGTIAGKGGDVVGTIDKLSTRGADFASVMNLDVNEAMALFQWGLAGESEPLRKFGLDLSAAAVQAQAYRTGIAESGAELTENQKVQARYSLLMRQTAKTQGDFTNTSDQLANSQRILGANLDNIQARVGTALLPVLTRLSSWALTVGVPAMSGLIDTLSGEGGGGASTEGFADGLSSIMDAARELGPALVDAAGALPSLSDVLNVGATAIGFFADNADLLVKALPYLVAGFIAFKAAQAAANAAALISVPVRIAEVIAIRAQTNAIRQLAASQVLGTVAQATNTTATSAATAMTLRQRAATILSAAAQRAVAAATAAWTVVQRGLNLALTMNPIGLVVAALGALVVGLVVAYKKSETFRNIVDGALRAVGKAGAWLWESALRPAFDGIKTAMRAVGDAGRWLWNKALAPAFRFIVGGVAAIMDIWAGMLRALGKVPGFEWAKSAAGAMQGAADKARALAEGIKNIPPRKEVTVSISITRSIRNIAQGIQGAAQSAVDQVTGGQQRGRPAPRAMGGLRATASVAASGPRIGGGGPLIWIENLVAHDEAAAMYAARVEAQKALALMGSP